MGFKKMETNFSFADISLFSSLERNRAIKRMSQFKSLHAPSLGRFLVSLSLDQPKFSAAATLP